jgi:hypothetical protein
MHNNTSVWRSLASFGCMRPRHLLVAVTLLGLQRTAAAQSTPQPRDSSNSPPAFVLGAFSDDYDGRYTISPGLWTHGSRARYHILKWNVAEQYLIARNDENNPSDMGLYTRIDWMPLDMKPFTWAFCMTAFKAPTADSAEATRVAKREVPRTGCSGFPFSRMKPSRP